MLKNEEAPRPGCRSLFPAAAGLKDGVGIHGQRIHP